MLFGHSIAPMMTDILRVANTYYMYRHGNQVTVFKTGSILWTTLIPMISSLYKWRV